MLITADENARIRGWIGTDPDDPTDVDISGRWDRLDDVAAVAEEILRERLADFITRDAADVDITGDVHEQWTANIAALEQTISVLEGITGSTIRDLPPVVFTELERPDWRRHRRPYQHDRWGR